MPAGQTSAQRPRRGGGAAALALAAAIALGLAGLATAQVEDAPDPAAEAPEVDVEADDAPGPAPADPTAEARGVLAEVEADLAITEERAAALRAEIEAMSGDRAQQNAELIAAAQRVRLAEIEVGAMEERLANLVLAETEIRSRLDGADLDLANILAAIQRIGRNPPPALIVDPSDALGSARSAILLSAVLPQLRARADTISADLRDLGEIAAAARAEEELLRANFATLQEEQLRIATLIEARRQGAERIGEELAAEESEAAALAAEAAALDQLIGTLQRRIAAATSAADAAAAAAEEEALSPEHIALAFGDPDRTEPALPFAAARGWLTMPASGITVTGFGANDGFGGVSSGLSIVTHAEAEVVAPADSWVLHAGSYLNYGQIVILNPGDEFSILLAGLDEVAVEPGQFVRMGEPLGTMGSQTVARTVTTSAGNLRPTLYIELRENDAPIDPAGWLGGPGVQPSADAGAEPESG